MLIKNKCITAKLYLNNIIIIWELMMSEANRVIKSNISGVEKVLVRGKGWMPVEEVEESAEVKKMAGWIKLGTEIMSNDGY
jgi:hypothetical protein